MVTRTPPLTYGQHLVGLDFNPQPDNPDVARIKEMYAEIIDLCDRLRAHTPDGEKKRTLSVAITEAQTGYMWAVKGITL
jgi:hypothetical protein